ncbi:hypothetical protein JCM8097_002114 [Rhodosporidiobolus ruineniae]
MSSSSCTLFYGLFVQTLPLILAAQAWPQLKQPLKALDWISQRRTNGTLETTTSQVGTIKRVPGEVWDMIKRELVGDELAQAQEDFIGRHAAVGDTDCDGCRPDGLSKRQAYTPELFARCDGALDDFLATGEMMGALERAETAINGILGSFGLAMAAVLAFKPSRTATSHLDHLTPLRLLPPRPQRSSAASSLSRQERLFFQSFAPVRVVPSDALFRFSSFLSTFPLRPRHLPGAEAFASYNFGLKLDDKEGSICLDTVDESRWGANAASDADAARGADSAGTGSADLRWIVELENNDSDEDF